MKNKFKFRITVLAFMLAFASITVFAQPGQGRRQMTEQDVKDRVERLAESLELSDAQTKEVMDFEMAQYKESAIERQNLAGDREAMREYMQGQREKSNKKYAEILTEEQMKQYTKIQEERRQNRQGRDQGGSSGGQRDRGRGGN